MSLENQNNNANEGNFDKSIIEKYLNENKAEPLHIILGWFIATLKSAQQTKHVFDDNPKYMLYLKRSKERQTLGEKDIHIRSQVGIIVEEGAPILNPKADENIRKTL